VTCLLHFNNIKRPEVFAPGLYSELFFLDEATAFAAGPSSMYALSRRAQQALQENMVPGE